MGRELNNLCVCMYVHLSVFACMYTVNSIQLVLKTSVNYRDLFEVYPPRGQAEKTA